MLRILLVFVENAAIKSADKIRMKPANTTISGLSIA
jgi:hypothetical protein